jgi:hypothetical protein
MVAKRPTIKMTILTDCFEENADENKKMPMTIKMPTIKNADKIIVDFFGSGFSTLSKLKIKHLGLLYQV